MENKSIDEAVFETREVIKRVVVDSKLPATVLEMILYGLYLELKNLSEQSISRILEERQNEQNQEEIVEDGEHTAIS